MDASFSLFQQYFCPPTYIKMGKKVALDPPDFLLV